MPGPVPLTGDLRAELASLGFFLTPDTPLDLLFSSETNRTQAKDVRAHRTSRPLPEGSLVRVSAHVVVASPELTFVQMSRILPFGKLIHVGCELCGSYALVGPEGKPQERPPLTDLGSLRAFAEYCLKDASAPARRALRYVLNGSASPKETELMLLLCLPGNLGGYGLPAPIMNLPFTLSAEAHAVYSSDPRLDLAWPVRNLDVEYDGEDSHTGAAHARGVARTMALRLDGVEVLVVAKQQLYNETAFEQVAVEIARKLDVRLRTRSAGAAAARRQLRRELGLA